MLDGLPEESRIFLKIIVTAYVLLAVFKNILLTKMANQLFLDKDIFRDADTYLSARHCFLLHTQKCSALKVKCTTNEISEKNKRETQKDSNFIC